VASPAVGLNVRTTRISYVDQPDRTGELTYHPLRSQVNWVRLYTPTCIALNHNTNTTKRPARVTTQGPRLTTSQSSVHDCSQEGSAVQHTVMPTINSETFSTTATYNK
jgi:hypothetical protein